jgi:AAA+ superfamily predicted ATPase
VQRAALAVTRSHGSRPPAPTPAPPPPPEPAEPAPPRPAPGSPTGPPPEPPAGPVAEREEALALHLYHVLEHLRALLTVQARRLQRLGLLPGGPGAAAGPGAPAVSGPDGPDAAGLAAITAAEAGRRAVEERFPDLPLAALPARFGLSEPEHLLLLLCLGVEFDPALARLYAFLQGAPERAWPSLALLAECLDAPELTPSLRSLLEPDAALRRFRLVRLGGDDDTATPHRPLWPDERVVRHVMGDEGLTPALRAVAELRRPDAREPLVLADRDRAELAALLELAREAAQRPYDLPVVVLRGPAGSGRRRWLLELGAALGRPTLSVDLGALLRQTGPEAARGVADVGREAMLHGALLAFHGWEEATRAAGAARPEEPPATAALPTPQELSGLLERVLGEHPLALAFALADGDAPPPALARERRVVTLALPDPATAAALWDRYLPARLRAPDAAPEALGAAFRLTPGQIRAAADEAVRQALRTAPEGAGRRVTRSAVEAALRAQLGHRLGENALRIETRARWEDLIVTEEVRFQLRELIARYRQTARVFDQWGLSRRFGDQRGLSVLFEGPPGTGKTMAAGLVAREVGLDLYQIDLSRTVSKYIGETEKNLARIFDEAERARVMLLFDEADSLFSRRTTVESANDRYANLEVNYLLQRIERFTGVAILTTNFPISLDDAFKRRLSMRVQFPKPSAAERARLWLSMLVNREILGADVDVDELAEAFELTGGHIRNAVLRATFVAAARDCRVDQTLLQLAARIELKEQGQLVHGSPYEALSAHAGAPRE